VDDFYNQAGGIKFTKTMCECFLAQALADIRGVEITLVWTTGDIFNFAPIGNILGYDPVIQAGPMKVCFLMAPLTGVFWLQNYTITSTARLFKNFKGYTENINTIVPGSSIKPRLHGNYSRIPGGDWFEQEEWTDMVMESFADAKPGDLPEFTCDYRQCLCDVIASTAANHPETFDNIRVASQIDQKTSVSFDGMRRNTTNSNRMVQLSTPVRLKYANRGIEWFTDTTTSSFLKTTEELFAKQINSKPSTIAITELTAVAQEFTTWSGSPETVPILARTDEPTSTIILN
jgi:hypothetical protein